MRRRSESHGEESEAYLESFLDVLLCGFGAALALMIVYSVLPKGGSALVRTAAEDAFAGGLPVPGSGGNDSTGAVAVPVALVNASTRVELPSTLPAGFEAFRLIPDAGGAAAATLATFRSRPEAGSRLGSEHLYRLSPFSSPVLLCVNVSLLSRLSTPVDVTLFRNGDVGVYHLKVARSGAGGTTRFAVTSGVPFHRVQALAAPAGFVPLLKLSPRGEVIGAAATP